MRGRVRGAMGAAATAGVLAVTGFAPAHAAGAVTDGATAYKIENCFVDPSGNKLCTTTEGRSVQVVLPNGRQINRDRGTSVSEGYTKGGVYYTVSGTHHTVMVYEEYVDPFFWDDQVGHLSATSTYSYADGTTCVVTEELTAVDSIIRHSVVDVVCS